MKFCSRSTDFQRHATPGAHFLTSRGCGGRPKWVFKASSAGYANSLQGLRPKTSKKAGFNHAGGGTPAHCLRSARPAEAATNFERTFTPRTWLRSLRNFSNARFRRFATFDFSTPIFFFRKQFRFFFSVFHHFRQIFEELGFF